MSLRVPGAVLVALALPLAVPLPAFAHERVFGTRDGLPQVTVHALAQTPDGYLWVGTEGGLARFDGKRFAVWRSEDTPALRIHRVTALLVDRDGDLWIGTAGGAGLIRHRGGRFETFEKEIGPGTVFCAFQDRRGDLWFGTPQGLIKRSSGRIDRVRVIGQHRLTSVVSITEDREGDLWIAEETAIVRVHDGQVAELSAADGVPLVPDAQLRADAAGTVWIGTLGGQLLRRGPSAFQRVTPAGTEGPGAIRALLNDRAGTTWIGGSAGLFRVRDGRVERAPDGTATRDSVESVLEDREGNLWVGTVNEGLVRVTQGAFATLPLEPMTTGSPVAVRGDPAGNLWIGTDHGRVLRVDDSGVTSLPRTADLDGVFSLDPDGRRGLWVAGIRGGDARVVHLDGAGRVLAAFGSADGLPRGAALAVVRLPGDEVLVGTYFGLFRVVADRVEPVPLPGAGPNTLVYAIHLDRDGVLWATDGGRGLLFRKGDTWQRVPRESLSNGQVYAIDEDDRGTLWLGTLNGFSRLREGHATAWRHATGFRDDPVFKALPDAAGNVWLCTPTGVLRVSAQAIAAYDAGPGKTLAYSRFDTADGLPSGRCGQAPGQGSGWRAPSGRLYFASGRTVAYVDPARLPSDHPAARPLIETITVDANAVDPRALTALPAGRGDLEIAYTSPSLTRPERLRFRYRLDPFDRRWIDAGERRVAFYTNVPPGRYQFRVVAGTPDGFADTTAAAVVALVLSPRVDQTWWFRVLVTLGAVAALGAAGTVLHRRRLRAIEAQHQAVLRERSRIGRELHDTLAQGFTGISVQLEAASGWMKEDPHRAQENLDKARALVRSSLADARRAVWDLVPEAVARGGLVAALDEMARGLSAGVAVRTQVNGQPRPLPPAFEAAVARVAQEALTNAIRHARAANVSIELSFLDDRVHLRVIDDGHGFDPDARPDGPGHLGLGGIRARAAELSAPLTIDSRPGGGTVITLVAPVPP